MKQLRFAFPDDPWRYLFLASPDRDLAARVMDVKEDFYFSYGHKIAVDTRPHITLAAFNATKDLEASLIALLQKICSGYSKFTALLQDFAGFERYDKSTIYIKVQTHQPFLELAKGLCAVNHLLQTDSCSSAYLVEHPHLTVAKWIPYLMYLEAMEDFSSRSFRDVFVVNNLLLLKKQEGDDKYQRVTTIRLF